MKKSVSLRLWLLCSSLAFVLFSPAHAVTIFSENFQDGTIDGWTTAGSVYANLYSGNYSIGMQGSANARRTISTSSDSFATTTGQTPVASGTQIAAANNLLRAGLPGVRRCWETSDAMGTGRNTNIWNADGVVGNRRTADGVHPTRISGDEVVAAGVFQASAFLG